MDVIEISKIVVLLFGVFLILSGFLMLFNPFYVKKTISKAGSTYFINYTELGIRLLIGIAFLYSDFLSVYDRYFTIIGYFLIFSALLLMVVPIKKHNAFSKKAADFLKPNHFKILGPISIVIGTILIYIIIWKLKN